jgi:hypothetical protein
LSTETPSPTYAGWSANEMRETRSLLAAAFLARSTGYAVNESHYPALSLSAESTLDVFAPYADGLKATQSANAKFAAGMGFIFLTGIAR